MAQYSRSRGFVEESVPFLDEEEGATLENYEDPFRRRRRCQCLLASLATLVIAAGLVVAIVFVAQEDGATTLRPQTAVVPVFQKAVVAADTTICSEVGKDILQKGGNAVDASIAALLCSGLGSPQSMGIGGGFFMAIYNRTTGVSTVIDARETAPEKATVDMFKGNSSASSQGKLSIAVPGEIKGYWHVHQRYGKLPWKDVFEPAKKMAADGFPVPIGLHKAILDDEKLLTTEPSLKVVFVNNKTGKLFKEGEIMKRPQLAETYRIIAEEGVNALYNGSLTDLLMEDLQDIDSIITRNDLLQYKVLEKKPVKATLKGGVKMVSLPPPASGPVLAFILNILDGYNLTSADIATDEAKILSYHRMVEAFKFAYAKRSDLGDEDFVDVTELVRNLTSRDYADQTRQMITDNTTHGYKYYGGTFYDRMTTGTSHLSVIDRDGNAVSTTSTINGRFGSKLRGMRTGIIFNNEMDDFAAPNITNEWGVPPSPANFIEPGKRPLSSMCPAVLINPDGSVHQVVGAAGGTKITTTTAWVIAHVLWFGQNIKEAVDSRRLHHQLLPPWINYETGFSKPVLKGLQQLNHNVTEFSLGASIVQAINERDGLIFAECDFRKGGTPAGF